MNQTLTGNRRFRIGQTVGCYGALILQVERAVWTNGDKDTLGRWKTVWSDATPDDVQETVVGLPDQRG
jgi:hypothetical protein